MEFNAEFYHRINKLVLSGSSEASSELKNIIEELLIYYRKNNITELWPQPAEPLESDPSVQCNRRYERWMPPMRREASAEHAGGSSPLNLQNSALVESGGDETRIGQRSENISPEPSLASATASRDYDSDGDTLIIVEQGVVSSSKPYKSKSSETSGNEVPSKRPCIATEDTPTKTNADITKGASRKTEEAEEMDISSEVLSNSPVRSSFDGMGLTCIVCRKFTFTATNALMECHECHTMYHQKCHQPNIAQAQIDPRVLWYCNSCSRKIKKPQTVITPSVNKLVPKVKEADCSSDNCFSNSMMQPFKRAEVKDLSGAKPSNSIGLQKNFPGIAAMAANFLAKHKGKSQLKPPTPSPTLPLTTPLPLGSKLRGNFAAGIAKFMGSDSTSSKSNISSVASSVSTASSSSFMTSASKMNSPSSHSLQAAEKRLQQMKKKAALRASYSRVV